MEIKVLFLLVAVFAVGATANDKKKMEKMMECIKNKFSEALKEEFTACHNRRKETAVPRIKKCFLESMEKADVVKKASNGQMTIDYNKFGEYGERNKNNVGKAVNECHKGKKKDDDMYQEVARAAQCVFEKLKESCK